MTKYAQYTLGELRYMIEKKYEKLLDSSSEKEIFIVSIDNYYGLQYCAFDKDTLKDFTRKELEEVLSSKFSPVRFIELDNIIVLHDGNAKLIKNNGHLGVWTGRINKKGLKEVLIDSEFGRWTWVESPSWHSERIRMNDIVKSFIDKIAQTGAISLDDARESVFKYYKKFLESGNSYSWKELLHIEKYAIMLGFEDNPEGMYVFDSKKPKLFIYKMNSNLKEETLSKIEELKEKAESKEERILLREMKHYIGDFSYMPHFMFSRREHDHGGAEFGYHFNLWFAEKFEEPYRKILKDLGFEVHHEFYDRSWMVYGIK